LPWKILPAGPLEAFLQAHGAPARVYRIAILLCIRCLRANDGGDGKDDCSG
jgi:hypothetical protein